MVVALTRIMRSISKPSASVTYNPEDYAAAGGELFVIAMISSWLLTFIFRPEIIVDNPLKDRVGYNNLCVGWDTPPAKYVAAPIFCMIIFLESRYMQLDFWRAEIDPTITEWQKKMVMLANVFNTLSWFGSIGIFVIDATVWPAGHTASFVQLVVLGYVAFLGNFLETDTKYHPPGSHLFMVIFGVVSVAFGICAMMQMLSFDPLTKVMGPVPWELMCFLDYGYFTCMALQGSMRPAAPSLCAQYKLVSDDDFQLPEQEPVKP
mmetsp:Transcript_48500/g.136428  ORF Transcript_48500/g.136428 Transcript_48500/m.136428 type:complete len:263 (-) Transcript_48500:146-934(-)